MYGQGKGVKLVVKPANKPRMMEELKTKDSSSCSTPDKSAMLTEKDFPMAWKPNEISWYYFFYTDWSCTWNFGNMDEKRVTKFAKTCSVNYSLTWCRGWEHNQNIPRFKKINKIKLYFTLMTDGVMVILRAIRHNFSELKSLLCLWQMGGTRSDQVIFLGNLLLTNDSTKNRGNIATTTK